MRVVAILGVALWLAAAAVAEEPPPERRAFLEVVVPSKTLYVGQVFLVRLRIGYDRAWFEKHAAPLFRRAMDLPVQVSAPWLREPGALSFRSQSKAGGIRLVVNDDVVEATEADDVTREGRAYGVVELTWQCQASVAGTTELPATLRFAHASRFEEDFVGGRVAVDRRDTSVAAAPATLRVEAPSNPPKAWRGAIGDFAIRSEVDRIAVRVGEIFNVTLHIQGKGNIESFQAPALQPDAGFHVYGTREHVDGERRTVVYEVAATRPDVTEVPPFDFFVLSDGQMRHKWTPPIPIRVTGSGPAAPSQPEPDGAVEATSPSGWLWLAVGVVAGLVLGLLLRGRRRVEPPGGDTGGVSQPAPTAAAPADRSDAATEPGFAAFLAARLGVPPATVITPDLTDRLRAAGVPRETAAEAARVLAAMVAARYGGASAPERVDPALIEALEQAFGGNSRGRA